MLPQNEKIDHDSFKGILIVSFLGAAYALIAWTIWTAPIKILAPEWSAANIAHTTSSAAGFIAFIWFIWNGNTVAKYELAANRYFKFIPKILMLPLIPFIVIEKKDTEPT